MMTNPYFNTQYPTYQPKQNNGINWVQGIEGAKAWQMMPNSNDILMDSENDGIFYIKICDAVGMCTLRTFQYKEVTGQQTSSRVNMDEYVKKSELQSLVNEMFGGADE